MIVATTDDLAIIGLSHKDLKQLKDGSPIIMEDEVTNGLVPGRKLVLIADTSNESIVNALTNIKGKQPCW